MTSRNTHRGMALAFVVTTVLLAGCDRKDQAEAKDVATDTAAIATQKAHEAGAQLSVGLDKAKVATQNAAAEMSAKIDDAVITTSVKTELAKDTAINPLKITVSTDAGRVALRGAVASNDARDRATAIAQGVKGVVGVDNQLAVESGKG